MVQMQKYLDDQNKEVQDDFERGIVTGHLRKNVIINLLFYKK